MDFSNILVISDLDGTLIGEDHHIPLRNREAIDRFQREGGHFTVATGRSLVSAGPYIRTVLPNTPGIILNGTVLYDFAAGGILWSGPMEAACAVRYIRKIAAAFPSAGMEVFAEEEQGVVLHNGYIREHLEYEGIQDKHNDILDGRPLCKVLIADDADVVRDVIAFTRSFAHPEVRFVTSSPSYLEMLPARASKGSALELLVSRLGFSMKNVYAIGDYYNDVELLETAGFAAMPQNAPDELKSRADLVVVRCGEGAVADLIETVERAAR